MKRIALAAALFALPLSTTAHAQQAAPASQWTVNVANGECSLERDIATPIAIHLLLKTVTGSDAYGLAIVGRDLTALPFATLAPVEIKFHDANKRFEQYGFLTRLSPELGNVLAIEGLGPDFVEAFGSASSISVSYMQPIVVGPFPLPRSAAATKAFKTCIRDQLVEWGADPAQFEPGGRTPVALKSRDDFVPNAALRKMARGKDNLRAAFRLSITVDGVVESCTLIDANNAEGIEKLACDSVLTKRLFAPAADPAGNPVRGVASFEVSLVMRMSPAR